MCLLPDGETGLFNNVTSLSAAAALQIASPILYIHLYRRQSRQHDTKPDADDSVASVEMTIISISALSKPLCSNTSTVATAIHMIVTNITLALLHMLSLVMLPLCH